MTITTVKDSISNLTLFCGDLLADAFPSERNSSFESNMLYAQEALSYAVQALPLGASNVSNAKVTPSQIRAMRVRCINKWKNRSITAIDNPTEEFFNLRSEIARQHKAGNCQEYAAVAFSYLKRNKNLPQVFICSLTNGDHAFTILSDKPLSKSSSSVHFNTSSMKSAIICDPWAGIAYPFKDQHYHLDNLCKIHELLKENEKTPKVVVRLPNAILNNKSVQQSPTELFQKYLFPKCTTPIKPKLSSLDELSIQTKLSDYHSFTDRANTHKFLYKASLFLAIFIASIGLLTLSIGLAFCPLNSYFWTLGYSCLSSAPLLFIFKEYFAKHETTYTEKKHNLWHHPTPALSI